MMLALLLAAVAQTTPAVAPALPAPPPPLVRPPKGEPVPGSAILVATEREAIRSYDMRGHDEARGRLIESVWPQIEALRHQYAKRLAGIYFDEDGALVLRLLGDRPVPGLQLHGRGGRGVLPVRFRTGWKLTDKQVLRHFHPHRVELKRRLPNMTSASVDERSGDLLIIVPGFDAATKAREKELSELVGAPVRIEVPGTT